MSLQGNGRTLLGFVVLGAFALPLFFGTSAPVGAAEPLRCRAREAASFRAAGERYRRQQNFAAAARWFLAAARTQGTCPAPADAVLSARSLAEAGAALAQSGDALGALGLLHAARSRLNAIPTDRESAGAARSCLDLVQRMISAVEELARESM